MQFEARKVRKSKTVKSAHSAYLDTIDRVEDSRVDEETFDVSERQKLDILEQEEGR